MFDIPDVVELYDTSREFASGSGGGLCELLWSEPTVKESVYSEPLKLLVLGGVVVTLVM